MEQFDDLPLILTPTEVQEILKWSKPATYRLFNSKNFPSTKMGAKLIIPKPKFLKWLGIEKVG